MEYYFPLPSFYGSNSCSTLRDWDEFKQRFSNYSVIQSNSIGDELGLASKAGSVLLHLGGPGVIEILKTASFESGYEVRGGETAVTKLLEKLEDLCLPRFLVLFERFRFFTCKQKENESICHFLAKLHWQAESCEFTSDRENRVRDQIIEGVSNENLRQHLRSLDGLDEKNVERICRQTDPGCGGLCRCCATGETGEGIFRENTEKLHDNQYREMGFHEVVDFSRMQRDAQEIGARYSNFSWVGGASSIGNDKNSAAQTEFSCKQSGQSVSRVNHTSSMQMDSLKDAGVEGNERSKMAAEKKTADPDGDDEILEIYDQVVKQKFGKNERGSVDCVINLVGTEKADEELLNLIKQDNVYICNDVVRTVLDIPEYRPPKLQTTKRPAANFKPPRPHPGHKVQQKRIRKEKAKLFNCEICRQRFFNSWSCYQHVREVHPEQAPYKCEKCGVSFMLQDSLNQHKLIHTADRKAKCPKCSAKFDDLKVLERHLRREHKRDRYPCKLCGKAFPYPSGLKLHEMKHTGERPFVCEICGSGHTVRVALIRHMKLHTGERPFKCSYCSKTFILKGHLNTHIRTHTGERPFVCHYCGVSFTKSPELKYHIRIHTGERPFSCQTCGRTFVKSAHLTRHKRVHTGEKRYTCNICGSKFTRLTNMRSHQRSIHGVEMATGSNDQDMMPAVTTSLSFSQ